VCLYLICTDKREPTYRDVKVSTTNPVGSALKEIACLFAITREDPQAAKRKIRLRNLHLLRWVKPKAQLLPLAQLRWQVATGHLPQHPFIPEKAMRRVWR
jgi:hypothetical protein